MHPSWIFRYWESINCGGSATVTWQGYLNGWYGGVIGNYNGHIPGFTRRLSWLQCMFTLNHSLVHGQLHLQVLHMCKETLSLPALQHALFVTHITLPLHSSLTFCSNSLYCFGKSLSCCRSSFNRAISSCRRTFSSFSNRPTAASSHSCCTSHLFSCCTPRLCSLDASLALALALALGAM